MTGTPNSKPWNQNVKTLKRTLLQIIAMVKALTKTPTRVTDE